MAAPQLVIKNHVVTQFNSQMKIVTMEILLMMTDVPLSAKLRLLGV